MRLVPEARKGHRLWSVQLGTLAAVVAGLSPVLPAWEGVLSPERYAVLASVIAMAGVIARFVPQGGIDDE